MPLVSQTVEVGADAAAILGIVSDFEAYPKWNDEVKAVYILARYNDGRPSQLRVDTEIAGVKIPAGEKVLMWYVSGNRDETAIENPDAFIIDRARPRQHLSFGFGIHRCVGNRLGEMQLRVTWEEILKRFDKIEVVEEPVRVPSCFVKGYERMMVRIPG